VPAALAQAGRLAVTLTKRAVTSHFCNATAQFGWNRKQKGRRRLSTYGLELLRYGQLTGNRRNTRRKPHRNRRCVQASQN